MKRPILIATAVLTVCCGSLSAQEQTLEESLRRQLETDRAKIYAMSAEERQQYVSQYFQSPDREVRRAFKKALEQVRGEWNIPQVDDGPAPEVQRADRAEAAAKVAGSSIQYDTGTVFGSAGVASQMLGNRFDNALNTAGTAISPVEATGSITMITFEMINTFFGSVVWSLYSNVMGTSAMQITSMARPGIMTGLNTLSVMASSTDNAYMNGTFLAGIWQFDPTMTALAVDTGSTGGQGFHGISLNDGATGTMLNTVTAGGMGVNAIFRVQGNVATPVELLEFTIDRGVTDGE